MRVSIECTCDVCKAACRRRPGHFLPGEAAKAASLLDMSTKEFFDQYLVVDDVTDSVFLLSPAIVEMQTGAEAPYVMHGACIFFKDGLCSIHGAKPAECREYDHTTTPAEHAALKRFITQAWAERNAKNEITTLLGREPKMRSEQDIIDALEAADPQDVLLLFSYCETTKERIDFFNLLSPRQCLKVQTVAHATTLVEEFLENFSR